MYVPIAIHKNELVVIDSMDTFSRFFCLAKKQKMTPLAADEAVATPEELQQELGAGGIFEDDAHPAGSESSPAPDLDEDEI